MTWNSDHERFREFVLKTSVEVQSWPQWKREVLSHVPRDKTSNPMEARTKYPRTFHLPWSEGALSDDKILSSTQQFMGREVVVTEKLDGENTTIYADQYLHARSLDSRAHTSQTWVRALAARIAGDIPHGWRVCGENVYAKHSILYTRLRSYFYCFGIYDEHNNCLPWSETEEWAALLGIEVVPVLYRGQWDREAVQASFNGSSRVGVEGEGYVVRVADGFPYEAFQDNVAKFVRANHVQTDKHWKSTALVANRLHVSPA